MKNPLQWMGTACLTLLLCAPVAAGDLMMARVNRLFPEAMTLLQSAISSRGYTVTRLQQVNENLQRREFKSDMYRVVYFGKYEEVRQATARNPNLYPVFAAEYHDLRRRRSGHTGDQSSANAAGFFPRPGAETAVRALGKRHAGNHG